MKTCAVRLFTIVLGILLTGRVFAAELPPAEPVDSLSPAYDRYKEMVFRARQLRKDGDTAGLEALADELRKSKDALDGGTWLLSHFYDTAARIPDAEPAAGEAVKFYEAWAKARPENITAQVCLARALKSHAWTARGSGWADSVTPEGWRLMEERLDRAWQVLETSGELEEQCPGWFEAGQSIGLGQGWEREDYLDFVDDAIAHEPTYGRYYTNTCYWLLPRWHGEEGDFEKWIAEQAGTYPEERRDWQYARFVWMADVMPAKGELVFAPGRLDWARTKRGFETWLAADPANLNVRFEFTRLALLAGDRETARAQFDVTGGKYFPGMWKGVEQFEQARRFAYEGGINPLAAKKPERKARREIPPETRRLVALILRVAAGFLGGALAGVCLLVLAMQRRENSAGVAALVGGIVAGTAFGTLATLVPAAILYLYLRRKKLVHPPELTPPSVGIVLLWVIALASASLLLQMGSAILAAVPLILEYGPAKTEEALQVLTSDGTIFRLVVVAGWLCFLGLLIACQPQNRLGWQRRLGLHRCPLGPAVLWTLAAGVILAGIGYVAEAFMDERSRESLKMIGEGAGSPFWFFLAVAVVAPFSEELLFRGYAYSGWKEKIGPWGAILLAAILFTFCHVQYGWVGLLYVFAIGVALGLLRWKTGSIYPCIVLHLLNNLAHCVEALLTASA